MEELFVGNTKLKSEKRVPDGQFVQWGDEKFYQIRNYDFMDPFFISIASESNHWMYISSTGGLTAGRKNPDTAIFPYYTDDKIHESAEITGSKTLIRVKINRQTYLWEPFSNRYKGIYKLERAISKSTVGNKIIFTEKNLDLDLTFGYSWINSDEFGWIKKSWLINHSKLPVETMVVDGLQNILPYGVNQFTQTKFSTLVDAYKKTEIISEAKLALFRMESIMVDRAEPSEALRVTSVWNTGFENASFLLSSKQLDSFRNGENIVPEKESKGIRGSFFVFGNLLLEPASEKTWYFVAEVNQDAVKINNLIAFIQTGKNISQILENSVKKGDQALLSIVKQADGMQYTADLNGMARHFSNVLFNTMRGGIYIENYTILTSHFSTHLQHFNKKVWTRNKEFLIHLPASMLHLELEENIQKQNDPNLYRLFLEYLPLTFSRRHGDPSRPWNLFNINVKDELGNKRISYQGNWRDIFQNWEALSLSYPGYIHSILAKFLNASTADGYNPYKITSEGIEWEVIEPDNPWSNIGYWGDHQIIYLLRLMEISNNYFPGKIEEWLNKPLFAYANVPYRLKSYAEIVANPKDTVCFDALLNGEIEKRVSKSGADAKLITNSRDEVMLVSLTEKLLASLLSKLSNFIPGAGIWMNTLRPEWNDANNALVGHGASMVTLYYMRRFVAFLQNLYQGSNQDLFDVSNEMAHFFKETEDIFNSWPAIPDKEIDDQQRRKITDSLGKAGENYRNKIYQGFVEKTETIRKNNLLSFFEKVLHHIDQSILLNQRSDGMFHSYNLVRFSNNSISIRPLPEMLEGQVAVLSSGCLSAKETLHLLNVLQNSALYRADQNSYILYPNKQLPDFIHKNVIPASEVNASPLLSKLSGLGDNSIFSKDKLGQCHFHADFSNAGLLQKALEQLKLSNLVETSEKDIHQVLCLYEKIFDHQSFTGRSGTFYKYEGLGCIYWHMVSKLLLSVGETIKKAVLSDEDPSLIKQLSKHYFEIKKGIGAHKTPAKYGSFPFDPYSHTPLMAGVQQPGMTGQVKEDIINRFFELGVLVQNGQLSFNPCILNKNEFNAPSGSDYSFPWLTFSYCGVDITYLIDNAPGIEIISSTGTSLQTGHYSLSATFSKSLFFRVGEIKKIVIHLAEVQLQA